ncbi:hypothetical protein [Sagittula salina]|uniref:Uncharacterized protein n=1 Tax=Sagittula salina TaxID=2820268 RepID=A0A940MTD1_9RHOB|nr:hypothetical protein [Sagittula salina]MBP0484687.1 hypothetical protein [Sagittula salina]
MEWARETWAWRHAAWFLRCVLAPVIEAVSMAAMYRATCGMLQISCCACAWLMQCRPAIAILDVAFWLFEHRHTRECFERCFPVPYRPRRPEPGQRWPRTPEDVASLWAIDDETPGHDAPIYL